MSVHNRTEQRWESEPVGGVAENRTEKRWESEREPTGGGVGMDNGKVHL